MKKPKKAPRPALSGEARAFLRFCRHRPAARVSLWILAILYLTAVFAEFIAPYGPNRDFAERAFHPPNLDRFSEELGFGPQIQVRALVNPYNREFVRVKNERQRVAFWVEGEPYRLFGLIPASIHLFGNSDPTGEPVYLFGADHLGRDLFSRIVYGSRISLSIGLIGITITMLIAMLLGGLAGYFGGWVDWLIMRLAEFFILIPGLYLILFVRSVLSRSLTPGQSYLIITVVLSVVGWPGTARLIRGLVLSIKQEDFVVNARLEGAPPLRIIFRHIIPQASSLLVVSAALSIPGYILGETLLSYLGLGISEPAVSWGLLINHNLTTLTNISAYPWFMAPGFCLLAVSLAYTFLGEALRDYLDPYFIAPFGDKTGWRQRLKSVFAFRPGQSGKITGKGGSHG